VRVGLGVGVRHLDAVGDRPLRDLLQAVIDRQLKRLARLRGLLDVCLADGAAAGVVVLLEHAVDAPQPAVVRVLHPGLAHIRAGLDAVKVGVLQLAL
jgi:hypothetical protein